MQQMLTAAVVVLSLMLLGGPVGAAPRVVRGDGKLALFNYHENQFDEVTFRINGSPVPEGLKQIQHLFRSRGDGTEHTIDLRLIDLIDHLQDHFGTETVELISGYRSPQYNTALLDEGKNVARESLHKLGMAADIHFDEIREIDLFTYAKSLGIGGVGIYPKHFFVHVDVGPVRTWGSKEPAQRMLIGTENNPNATWSAITDRNLYQQGDALEMTLSSSAYNRQTLVKNVWWERFRHGAWSEHEGIEGPRKIDTLRPGEKTTFSWKIPENFSLGKYRLVIFPTKNFNVPPIYSNEFYVRKEVSQTNPE